MAIKHIVLLPFKTNISDTEIEKIRLALEQLKMHIPQILSFSWGKNNSIENLHHGYLHGFIMAFNNANDRKIYLEHPEHTKLVQILLPMLHKEPLVFDY
jgi:hypothetical protein